jgi:hypothetical protein
MSNERHYEIFRTLLTGDYQMKSHSPERTYHQGIIIGLMIGAFFSLSGLTIIIFGFTGEIDFFLTGAGFTARLANATPGVFLAFLGCYILIKYKPKIFRNRMIIRSKEDSGKKSIAKTHKYESSEFRALEIDNSENKDDTK